MYFISILLGMTLLAGCTNQPDSQPRQNFKSSEVGVALISELGVVLQRRQVSIDGGQSSSPRGLGAGAGAIAGAAIGAAASESALGTAVGALSGGLLGHAIQGSAGSSGQAGFEYSIKLKKSEQVITVVQPASVDIGIGQHVIVSRNPQTNTVRLEQAPFIG